MYVSGLPEEVEEEELLECFKVAGLFKLDAESGQPKLRMYKDEAGRPKPNPNPNPITLTLTLTLTL